MNTGITETIVSIMKRTSSSLRKFGCMLLFLASVVLTSCQKSDGTHLFLPTHSDGWDRNDTIVFQIPASQEENDYDLQVELRIDNRYSYQDLWVVLSQAYETKQDKQHHSYTTVELKQNEEKAKHETFVSHHQHYDDTLHLQLSDDRRLNGTGKDLLVYRFPVRNVHLVRQEQGTIVARHIMDSDTIVGIHNVGISFLPVN